MNDLVNLVFALLNDVEKPKPKPTAGVISGGMGVLCLGKLVNKLNLED